MTRTFRKQTRTDFDARVRRIDPRYAATGEEAFPGRVHTPRLRWSILGFFWIICAVMLLQGGNDIDTGTAPSLALALGVTSLVIALRLARCTLRKSGSPRPTTAILAGGLAALAITHVPAELVESGIARIAPTGLAVFETLTSKVTGLGREIGAFVDVVPG